MIWSVHGNKKKSEEVTGRAGRLRRGAAVAVIVGGGFYSILRWKSSPVVAITATATLGPQFAKWHSTRLACASHHEPYGHTHISFNLTIAPARGTYQLIARGRLRLGEILWSKPEERLIRAIIDGFCESRLFRSMQQDILVDLNIPQFCWCECIRVSFFFILQGFWNFVMTENVKVRGTKIIIDEVFCYYVRYTNVSWICYIARHY